MPVTDVRKAPANSSVAIHQAFSGAFDAFGGVPVSVCLFLFVLSAMIVIVFYAEKQAELRFGATGNKIVR